MEYCIGQKIKISGVNHILAQVLPAQCCLIGIQGGNRYVDPIAVRNVWEITRQEIDIMAGHRKWVVAPERKRKQP